MTCALEIEPGRPETQVYLGMIRLAQGRQEEGWPLYQARWRNALSTEKLRYPQIAHWNASLTLAPVRLIESLASHRTRQGGILISTLLCSQQVIAFWMENWDYCVPRNGHISFMTTASLMHCARGAGLVAHSFSEKVHVLFDAAEVPARLVSALHSRPPNFEHI